MPNDRSVDEVRRKIADFESRLKLAMKDKGKEFMVCDLKIAIELEYLKLQEIERDLREGR